MKPRVVGALILSWACASCTEFPPPEQPFAAVAAVKKLNVEIAPAKIVSADSDCKPSVLVPLLSSELDQALGRAGYTVVRSGAADLTLTLTLEVADCAAVDAAVQNPATVSLDAQGHERALFEAKEPYSMTRNASVQSISYSDWAARIVNDLSRSPAVAAYATTITAPQAPVALLVRPSASAVASAPPPSPFIVSKPHPERHALIVGISDYRSLPPATGARSDAERFADLAKTTLGIDASRVHLLTDADATSDALDHALAALANEVAAGDRVYVYFAGDGSFDSGVVRLELRDGDTPGHDRSPFPLTTIAERLRPTKAASIVVILDAGFSGNGERSAPNEKGARGDSFLATVPPNWVIVSGAKRSQELAKSRSGGLFTETLLAALGTGAADIDGDQAVSLAEISTWVGPRVARAAKEAGHDQSLVVVTGSAIGDPAAFVLATVKRSNGARD